MPTTAVTIPANDDLEVDFDAIDRKVAEGRAQSATPEPKATAKPADEPIVEVIDAPAAKMPILKPEDGLEKLRLQLEAEKTARLASDSARQVAEQHAREASQAEVEARTKTQGTELEFLTTAIASVTQQTDALESRYAEAMAAQDYAGAAKAQREMATNAAKLQRLEEGKSALEKAPKPQPRQFVDPVERFASTLDAPSAAWIRSHPEYVRDPKKNRALMAAHNLTESEDIRAGSPEYFARIEETLKLRQPDPVIDDIPEPVVAAQATGGRRAAPASAPVSRAGSGQGSRPNTVRLTSEEVEMAKMMDMTPEQYARQKVALQREGKLN
jgi:hypothetical protein